MQRVETRDHERATEPGALVIGVNADHVDLAERLRLVGWRGGMDLRPAEAGEPIGRVGEEEASRLEPRLGFPATEVVVGPGALIRIAREGAGVDSQPLGLVPTGLEGAHVDAGRPARRFGERERHPHLPQLSCARKARCGREPVSTVVGAERPQHEPFAAVIGHRVRRGLDQVGRNSRLPMVRVNDHRSGVLAVGTQTNVHGSDGCSVRLRDHECRVRAGSREVEPHVITERRVSIIRLGRVGERAQHGDVFGRDRAMYPHVDHHTRLPAYRATVARPRGAQARADTVVERLTHEYPGSACELCALVHDNPFQLLIATILSAQCTDEMVNKVTPEVFARYPSPPALAAANPDDVETLIHPTGFFRQKTKSLIGMARALEERFDGQVPKDLDDLVTLPGVGRKTGNVIRSVAFDLPGLPVDTHVGRLSRRLKLTNETDPVKVEHELDRMVPPEARGGLSLRLIHHGRQVCDARRPRCDVCLLNDVCPSAFKV